MTNYQMLSDTEIIKNISNNLKAQRLKQNISREEIAQLSNISLSSVIRIENGEIKSFEAFLRILRTLGKIDILQPLFEDEELSPNEQFKLMQSAKKNLRKRASKKKTNIQKEDSQW